MGFVDVRPNAKRMYNKENLISFLSAKAAQKNVDINDVPGWVYDAVIAYLGWLEPLTNLSKVVSNDPCELPLILEWLDNTDFDDGSGNLPALGTTFTTKNGNEIEIMMWEPHQHWELNRLVEEVYN
jgi:hypothetical protein